MDIQLSARLINAYITNLQVDMVLSSLKISLLILKVSDSKNGGHTCPATFQKSF